MQDERYSEELNKLLDFINKELVFEHPTPVITLEYFVLGVFEEKKTAIYKIFYDNMLSSAIDMLHEAYFQLVSNKSLSAIRPNREVRMDDKFIDTIRRAEDEKNKLGAEKITTEHIFLAILNDSEENNKIKKVFEKAGINYSMLFEKIKNKPQINKTKDVKPKAGNGQTVIEVRATGDNPGDIMNIFMNGMSNMRQGEALSDGSALKNYCTNLNEQVRKGKIDMLVGRKKEVDAVIRVLGRRKKNNAILIGNGGVGKTAILEGIAWLIENNQVPPILYNREILSLNMTALMSGTTLRGMFEERVNELIKELKENQRYLLAIDNIDSTLSAKNGQEEFGLAAMLSQSLDSGDIQVIGTCDFKGYRNVFDKDPSLGRKFQKIVVESPTSEETLDILNNIKPYYETYHRVIYDEGTINSCIELAEKYITERNLPDSAIDVLDEVGSSKSPNNLKSEEIEYAFRKVDDIRKEINRLREENKISEVNDLLKEEEEARNVLTDVTKQYEENLQPSHITNEDILNIISLKTGVPVTKLSIDDKTKMLHMNERIKSEVIGQDEAVDAVCKAIKRNRVGLKNGRTYGAFLFLGGTGRGKSLLAKKLAKEVFGDEGALVRFDMSEYMDKTSVNKLIGANPGYVGYAEGGLMTEQIKNKKHCVILLDEIEKADPEVYNIFLQVFDEGFLTDNSGQKIDFKNTIIILTSNAGAKAASELSKGIGFNEDEDKNSKKILLKQLKNRFPPEFLNRLDDIIYFNKLSEDNLKEIIKLEFVKTRKRVEKLGYLLSYEDSAVDLIYNQVKNDSEFGARPIIRAIENTYEDKLTDLLLETDYEQGHTFNFSALNGEANIS